MYFMSHTGTDGANIQTLGEDPAAGIATLTMQSAAAAINAGNNPAPSAEAGIIMTQMGEPDAVAPVVTTPSFWQLHKKKILIGVAIGVVIAGGAYVYVRRKRAAELAF